MVERYNRYPTRVNSLQGSEQFAAVFLLEVKRVIDGENVASLYNVFIFTNLIQKCSNCCIYCIEINGYKFQFNHSFCKVQVDINIYFYCKN